VEKAGEQIGGPFQQCRTGMEPYVLLEEYETQRRRRADRQAGEVDHRLVRQLRSFKTAFSDAAMTQFGSGWAWLVQEGNTLKIVKTSNADTPIAHGQIALLACDVWEHAYYLDYQNRRKDFVQAFLNHLANWEFAASQLK
jgi:superoxide dismutase